MKEDKSQDSRPESTILWEDTVPLMKQGYHKDLVDKAYSYENERILPTRDNVFASMRATSFTNTKVVIIGQDPYFNEHPQGPEAHGLAFSVRSDIPIPPSLRNIFKEVNRSIYGGEQVCVDSDLTRWATQGVLLLNASLTVVAKKPNSHVRLGWHRLTDNIIETLSLQREHLVFMLWGAFAQQKASLIDKNKHCVLMTSHPSPLSSHRGFLGSDVFLQCNKYLEKNGMPIIIW